MQSQKPNDVANFSFVIGTRPEAIKLAPIIRDMNLCNYSTTVLLTGQHTTLVENLLTELGVTANAAIRIPSDCKPLCELTGFLIPCISDFFIKHKVTVAIVQGDTTSALCGAIAASFNQINVAHVEAGLRSYDHNEPFPEEINRCLISKIATWHFTPTERATEALVREGVPRDSIHMTGNTVIDSLLWTRRENLGISCFTRLTAGRSGQRKALLTLHRRESQGKVMSGIFDAIVDVANRFDLDVVIPLHPNPAVRSSIPQHALFSNRLTFVDSLSYCDLTASLVDSDMVFTDSGGIQEEAPALGKPVFVLRNVTERPEAIEVGSAALIGTDRDQIVSNLTNILQDQGRLQSMMIARYPFGRGMAAEKIKDILVEQCINHDERSRNMAFV